MILTSIISAEANAPTENSIAGLPRPEIENSSSHTRISLLTRTFQLHAPLKSSSQRVAPKCHRSYKSGYMAPHLSNSKSLFSYSASGKKGAKSKYHHQQPSFNLTSFHLMPFHNSLNRPICTRAHELTSDCLEHTAGSHKAQVQLQYYRFSPIFSAINPTEKRTEPQTMVYRKTPIKPSSFPSLLHLRPALYRSPVLGTGFSALSTQSSQSSTGKNAKNTLLQAKAISTKQVATSASSQ